MPSETASTRAWSCRQAESSSFQNHHDMVRKSGRSSKKRKCYIVKPVNSAMGRFFSPARKHVSFLRLRHIPHTHCPHIACLFGKWIAPSSPPPPHMRYRPPQTNCLICMSRSSFAAAAVRGIFLVTSPSGLYKTAGFSRSQSAVVQE